MCFKLTTHIQTKENGIEQKSAETLDKITPFKDNKKGEIDNPHIIKD